MIATTFPLVAKIDAVRAEYSAFETLHETDGLTDAENWVWLMLLIALWDIVIRGHCNYNTPDDFSLNDFERTVQSRFV